MAAKTKESTHTNNKWIILILLAAAQFMVVLDTTIVNVALPTISRKLNFAPSDLQWVLTAYTITFGGFLLLGGRASDLLGRKKVFLTAVSLFSLFSLFCGLATSSTELILLRALQGLAAAIMSPSALSILLTEFEEGPDRNKAMGVWGGVAAGGSAAGLFLGGIITQYLNWNWNFFINLVVGVIVVVFAYRLLPKHEGEEKEEKVNLDLPGAVLGTGGLMSLVYGLSKAPTLTWSSKTVWEFIVGGIVLLVLFVINENRAEKPLMSLDIFKIRNVSGGNAAFLAIACTMFAMFFFLTLYVQDILGFGPAKTGVYFLPVTLIIGIVAGLVSTIVGKIGYKPPMVLGPIVLAVGLFVLSVSLKVHGTYWADVFPGLALSAAGMGLTFISGTLAATSGVPKHFSGLASGILNTSQQVGGATGLGILSAIAYSQVNTANIRKHGLAVSQVTGYKDALRVGVYLAIAAAVVVILVVKNKKVSAKEAMASSM